MDIHSQKQRFLLHEISLLSLTNALSTRDKAYPVYAPQISEHHKQQFKHTLRTALDALLPQYNHKKISEDEHIAQIEQLSARLTQQFGTILHEQTFRLGVAQKLLNLQLKYLWATGFLMREPPHCPIDHALREYARLDYHWVSNHSTHDYQRAIAALKRQAHPLSLAMWELKHTQKYSE